MNSPSKAKAKRAQAMPAAAQKTKPPVKKKRSGNLVPDSAPLRGRAARLAFILDVAAQGKISVCDVRKVLDGLRVAVARHLRESSTTRIPQLVQLRVKTLPARDTVTKMINGKERVWKARQYATKKVVGSALKALQEVIA